uniref:Tethering factor for nuclear proteasome STS1 n=1 Tax=Graphocephala atropunctata TaxID=36148 RepID=A0A1B6MPU1_9HEMI
METPPHDTLHVRRSTRSALAEIPARIGAMSFSDNVTPVTRAHNMFNGQTNLMNIPASYISPSPSPDELIIQQRGRRKMPVTWSPDIDYRKRESAPAPRERTPVKLSPNKSQIVLRSTPRKRLLLNDPKDLCLSPEKRKTSSPNAKKLRFERPAELNSPLESALKSLTPDQLIGIIQNIVTKHSELEEEIKQSLPVPDLSPLEERLNELKRNIYKSLPSSRLTSKTDSPAYSRAAIHVLSFKKCVLEQGRQLVESQQWHAVLEYIQLAWSYVRATPLWDNPPHNAARRQCFKSLAAQCMMALRQGYFSPDLCEELYNKMESYTSESEDFQTVLKFLDTLRKT